MNAPSLRAGLSAAAIGSLVLLTGACAKTQSPFQTTATPPSSISITTPSVSIPDVSIPDIPGSTPTSGKSREVPDKATTTTAKAATGGEFGKQSYDAIKGKLGDFKALEYTIFFGAQQRAQVQAQDPAKPQNVDEYTVTGSAVSSPSPVKLTGDGNLDENVFDPSTIAWDKLPDMMEQAKTSIPIGDGKGVTHVIIKKNLPFDADTVVDVYIDGGARSDGGYVMFLGDGTLKKVYGPS